MLGAYKRSAALRPRFAGPSDLDAACAPFTSGKRDGQGLTRRAPRRMLESSHWRQQRLLRIARCGALQDRRSKSVIRSSC
jgi:hypothetical protein